MSWYSEIKSIFAGDIVRGKAVARVAQTYPLNAPYNLFTVVGGLVVITSLVGEVTVNLAGGANASLFAHDPTVGAAVNFDDGTLDFNGLAAGTLIAPTGAVGVATIAGQAVRVMAQPMVCKPGFVTLTMAAATLTGQIKFILHYEPLDSGATVIPT